MRRRGRTRIINKKILIVILFIMLFFFGTAYSALSQTLTLGGVVNVIVPPHDVEIDLDATFNTTEVVLNSYLVVDVKNTSGIDINNVIIEIEVPKNTRLSTTGTTLIPNVNKYVTISGTTLIINLPVGSSEGSIAAGQTKSFTVMLQGRNKATAVNRAYTVVSSDSLNSANSASLQSYTLNTPMAYSLNDYAGTELKGLNYNQKDVSLNVTFKEDLRSDGKIETIAAVNVLNNSDKKLKNLSFDINYNEPNPYCYEVASTSLRQTATDAKGSSYEMLDFDYIPSISSKTYQITGFVSDERFKSFTISNIKYELEEIEIPEKTEILDNNINETNNNNDDIKKENEKNTEENQEIDLKETITGNTVVENVVITDSEN